MSKWLLTEVENDRENALTDQELVAVYVAMRAYVPQTCNLKDAALKMLKAVQAAKDGLIDSGDLPTNAVIE